MGNTAFTANAGKWMNAPKSAGFLHARPERQSLLHPLIVSWG
jgi:isopenicillin-N epimerase